MKRTVNSFSSNHSVSSVPFQHCRLLCARSRTSVSLQVMGAPRGVQPLLKNEVLATDPSAKGIILLASFWAVCVAWSGI